VLQQEREHLFPAVQRLLDAVRRPVVAEEAMPGTVVPVKLVLFAMLLELGLVLVDLLRVGARSSLTKRPSRGQERFFVNSIGAVGCFGVSSALLITTRPPQKGIDLAGARIQAIPRS
jgi:hypothetical protein